ncbi:MAG: ABC transporter permease, partial [Clostridiales bacterium]|nr:ABC transporter permease [Clostridiales bacterium]
MAIIIGMLVGLVILLLSNPGNALPGFWAIVTGGLKNPKNTG